MYFFLKVCILLVAFLCYLEHVSAETYGNDVIFMLSLCGQKLKIGLGTFEITSPLAKITDTAISSGSKVGWMLSAFRNLSSTSEGRQ